MQIRVVAAGNWYRIGKAAVLTPLPASGWVLDCSSGDAAAGHERDNPLLVTMEAPKRLAAAFVQSGGAAGGQASPGSGS